MRVEEESLTGNGDDDHLVVMIQIAGVHRLFNFNVRVYLMPMNLFDWSSTTVTYLSLSGEEVTVLLFDASEQ